MQELDLTLAFACCTCDDTIHVRLHCAGVGLAGGYRSVAAVPLACPTCGSVLELCFEPNGTVRDVRPYDGPRPRPVPSVN